MISILDTSNPDYPNEYPNPQTRLEGNCEADEKPVALGQIMPGTGFKLKALHQILDLRESLLFELLYYHTSLKMWKRAKSQPRAIEISFTARDIIRWKMAWRAVQICRDPSPGREVPYRDHTGVPRPLDVFRTHQDWPNSDGLFDDLAFILGFSVAGIIYGGLHALAWSAHFQSHTEQLLWRISACIVMAGVLIEFILVWAIADLDIDHVPGQSRLKELWNMVLFLWVGVILMLIFTVFLAYVLARVYLVVECFINLSELPAGVYDLPNWSAYFPHIA